MNEKILQPWHILVLGLAGYINEEQQQVVEYLQTENKILKEVIGRLEYIWIDPYRGNVKGNILLISIRTG